MSKLFWDTQVPWLRLNGSGARQFLQGQTSADLNALQSGDLLQTCWLTATGRLRAVLELRFDAEGADVIVLAGEASAVHAGFDQVIFPADRVRLQPLGQLRRLQWLEPMAAAVWCDPDAALPEPWASGEAATATALEQWRLQTGFPPGPCELNGETNPLELGLVAHVSTEKGCYLGQETMAKLIGQAGGEATAALLELPQSAGGRRQAHAGWRASRGDHQCARTRWHLAWAGPGAPPVPGQSNAGRSQRRTAPDPST